MVSVERAMTEMLRATIDGDAMAVQQLAGPHQRLVDAAAAAAPLKLRRDAVVRVLRDRRSGAIPDDVAQAWASLMKRGWIVVPGSSGPVSPISIEWEDEDLLVEPLGRLDELGDAVDGTMSDEEIDGWIARLSA